MNEAESREYEALTAGVGLARMPGRTLIELTGRDRAAFLHNFSTNDIRGLAPGGGCEAFITSVQGKILGHAMVLCGPESLVLDTVPGQGKGLIAHLDRYLIREDVTIRDRSGECGELLLAGQLSESFLPGRFGIEPRGGRLSSKAAQLFGQDVVLVRVDFAGPVGFLIRAAAKVLGMIEEELVVAGAVACSAVVVETLRIEQGWPLYGRDITDKNLPQEVGRDRQAISFVKGCYLGQETVARIDALGHVNRTLCGLRFSANDVPPDGTPLTSGDQQVGQVTSAEFSPRLGAPLALGYVRRGQNEPGTRLNSPLGLVEVVSLPL